MYEKLEYWAIQNTKEKDLALRYRTFRTEKERNTTYDQMIENGSDPIVFQKVKMVVISNPDTEQLTLGL